MCFEVKYGCVLDLNPIESNETLIEVVLEEVLDLTHADTPEIIPEIIFDEYRILAFVIALAAAVFTMIWWLNTFALRERLLRHPIYLSKTGCLPGYYSFLSRYRLF